MPTITLADVATTNQRIENITDYEEWSKMVECTQQTLERVAE
jgi:hypothetical protein